MTDSNIEFEQAIEKEIRVDSEGKGFASVKGVSRLAGVANQTLFKHFHETAETTSKLAQMLISKGFKPSSFVENGGVPDVAIALIIKYYAYQGNEIAQNTDLAFASIGVRVWIQKIKGWQEPKVYESIREFVIAQLPETPASYQVRYPKRFWDALEELYGLRRGHRGCASFINAYIYNFFPSEVRDRLDEINPLLDDGTRTFKQHQHFDDVLLKVLIEQIERVITLLQVSQTKDDFQQNMKRLKPYRISNQSVLKIEESK